MHLMTRAEIDALHTKVFKERMPLNNDDVAKITYTVDILVKKSRLFVLPSGERAIVLELKIIFDKSKKLDRIAGLGLKLVG